MARPRPEVGDDERGDRERRQDRQPGGADDQLEVGRLFLHQPERPPGEHGAAAPRDRDGRDADARSRLPGDGVPARSCARSPGRRRARPVAARRACRRSPGSCRSGRTPRRTARGSGRCRRSRSRPGPRASHPRRGGPRRPPRAGPAARSRATALPAARRGRRGRRARSRRWRGAGTRGSRAGFSRGGRRRAASPCDGSPSRPRGPIRGMRAIRCDNRGMDAAGRSRRR